MSTHVQAQEAKLPSLWRNRAFNLLWGSQALSGLGSSISGLAMPLLTLAITGSPILAGIVGFVWAGVQLATQMPIGVVTDRFDRRKLMLTADAVRLTAKALLAWAVLTGRANLAWIIAVTVVDAMFTVLHQTSQFGAVRAIVPLPQVAEATAANQARLAATNLAGPPIGGALFGFARSLPFIADAISDLLSFIGVWLIRRPLQQERTEPREHPVKELVEGVRFTFGEPFLRTVILIAPPFNVAVNGLAFAVIVILQQQGTAPALIGVAEAIISMGALAGGLLAPFIVRRVPMRPLVIGGFWVFTALMAAGSLLTGSILVALPLALTFLLIPSLNSMLFGYQAAVTPDRLQGRVISVIFTGIMSVATISALLAGAFVHWWGGPSTVLAFAAIMSISALGATFGRIPS